MVVFGIIQADLRLNTNQIFLRQLMDVFTHFPLTSRENNVECEHSYRSTIFFIAKQNPFFRQLRATRFESWLIKENGAMRKIVAASCLFFAACSWILGSSAFSETNWNYDCIATRHLDTDEEENLLLEELRILKKLDQLCLDLKGVQRKIEDEQRKLDEIRHRLSCMKYKRTY